MDSALSTAGKITIMGINRQTDLEGELQIGPTSLGLVRIYVSGQQVDLPMDFTPDEAREIAAELVEAAERAGANRSGGKPKQAATGKKQARSGKPGQSANDTHQAHARASKSRRASDDKRPPQGRRGK